MAKVEHEYGSKPQDAVAHVVHGGEIVKSYRRKHYGKEYKDMANQHAKDLGEEVINEISTPTLQKYASKADHEGTKYYNRLMDGSHENHLTIKDVHKWSNRDKFREKALDRIKKARGMTEEVEQIDELSRNKLFKYMNKARPDEYSHDAAALNYQTMKNKGMKHAEAAEKAHGRKAINRYKGIGRAGSKLQNGTEYIDHHGNGHKARVAANEEVEQIDELSKKTLNNYEKKSISHQRELHKNAPRIDYTSDSDREKHKDHIKKRQNRENGEVLARMKANPDLNRRGMRYAKIEANEETGRPLSTILEDMKRHRGRPKKKRDMQGNVIEDEDEKQ